jgi:TatA/E family protein of Tat protein translocase
MPFIGNLGPGELLIILVIALVLVGPGKLPEVGSALGKSIREFRKAASDVKDATSLEPLKSEPATPSAPAAAVPVASAPAAATPVASAPPAPVLADTTAAVAPSAPPEAPAPNPGPEAPAS